jgi:peptidoglycan/LPS O-acetylase OafA/YrhL
MRVRAFDGLRAIAALSVLVYHVATTTGHTRSGWAAGYLVHLDVGVSLFFVLSGFLLYRPIAFAHLGPGRPPRLGRYLRRRALRILPAYWVALAFTAFVLHQSHIETVGDGVVFFGLFQIYSGDHVFGGLVQAWSLCTEVTFYLFLPVYGWALARPRRSRSAQLRVEMAGLVALYAASVGFRLLLFARDAHIGYAWLPAYLDVFALGMGLAVLSAHTTLTGARPLAARVLAGSPALVWAAAAAMYVALASLRLPVGLEPITANQYMTRQLLAGTIAFLIVGAAAMTPARSWLGGRALESRPLRALGFVSYGIFLWHLTAIESVIDAADHRFARSFTVVLVATLVLTIVAAVASYFIVEQPALAVGEPKPIALADDRPA